MLTYLQTKWIFYEILYRELRRTLVVTVPHLQSWAETHFFRCVFPTQVSWLRQWELLVTSLSVASQDSSGNEITHLKTLFPSKAMLNNDITEKAEAASRTRLFQPWSFTPFRNEELNALQICASAATAAGSNERGRDRTAAFALTRSRLIESVALERRGINQMKTFISIQNFMTL